jgi:hypothetical protein
MPATASIQDSIVRVRFSGHESFSLRFSWLAKGVRFCKTNPTGFSDPEAMVALGVGKNMVRSIRFWCSEAQMIAPAQSDAKSRTPSLAPTPLGEFLFGEDGADPYVEDPATLWLIHWGLASRCAGPTTWYVLFNEVRSSEFSARSLVRDLRQYEARCSSDMAAEETIERDVDCCLRCYVGSTADKKLQGEDVLDCPLADLDLVHRGSEAGGFSFPRGPRPTLSLAVFAACLAEYCGRTKHGAKTRSFEQIAYGPESPGQVFRLSENALMDLLEELDAFTSGSMRLGTTAGLRQLLLSDSIPNPMTLLKKHFKRRHAHASH